MAYSCGSAHADDYLFQFVPELTEAYVVTNELETHGTNCHDRVPACPGLQAPGLAVQEICAGMTSMPHAILASDRE